MNELEKKIAETLGSLMLENRKLVTALEEANAENQKLKDTISGLTKKNAVVNGRDEAVTIEAVAAP